MLPRRYSPSLSIGVVLILMLAGVYFLPEIVSTVWHIRHGESTNFHGWNIPVPRGWAAFTRGDLYIIQKILRVYQREDAPTIALGTISPSKPVDPERLKQASIEAMSNQGYIFQQEVPIQIATHRGYCLDFTTGNVEKSLRISCTLTSANLSVDYFGRSSERQTFYAIVARIGRDNGD